MSNDNRRPSGAYQGGQHTPPEAHEEVAKPVPSGNYAVGPVVPVNPGETLPRTKEESKVEADAAKAAEDATKAASETVATPPPTPPSSGRGRHRRT